MAHAPETQDDPLPATRRPGCRRAVRRGLRRPSGGLLSCALASILLPHPAMAKVVTHEPAPVVLADADPETHGGLSIRAQKTPSERREATRQAFAGRGVTLPSAMDNEDALAARARATGARLLALGILWDDRELARLRRSLPHLSQARRLERRYQILRRLIWLGRTEEAGLEVRRLAAQADRMQADGWRDLARVVRAWLPAAAGRPEQALGAFRRLAEEFATRARPVAPMASARFQIMRLRLAADLGRPKEAMTAMRAAYRLLDRLDHEERRIVERELAMQFGMLSAVYLDLKGMVEAYGSALAPELAHDPPPNVGEAVYALGNVLTRRSHEDAARTLFEGLRDLGRRRKSSRAVFLGEYGLMKVAHNEGRFADSDAHARAALAAETPPVFDRVVIAQHMAFNALGRGDVATARRHLATARAGLAELPERIAAEIASYDHLIEADILTREGRIADAVDALRRYARLRLRASHELYRRESAFLLSRLDAELDAARLRSVAAAAEADRRQVLLREQRLLMVAAAILAAALLLAFLWQRRVARRLREARRAADAANRAKSEFLAGISHELRTPLNAIIGFSELMERELFGRLGDDRYREYAAAIRRSGSHLLAVIEDIIDLSRVEAGEFRLEEEVADVRDDIAAARELVLQRMEGRRQRLVLDIPADFPKLRADHRLLRQIFLNLLSNAVKFSPEGTRITIRARVGRRGDAAARADGDDPAARERASARLWFAVEDEGPGMTEEQRRVALEPFGRVVADTDGVPGDEGCGLGLSLVQRFVALHGGGFELDSAPGRGTCARFWLPGWRAAGTDGPAPCGSADER